MGKFADSYACRSRVHCETCRADPAWRANVGAPEICPFGLNRRVRLTVLPDYLLDRLAICEACEEREGDACRALKAMGRPGILMHPRGIPRREAKCPLGRW